MDNPKRKTWLVGAVLCSFLFPLTARAQTVELVEQSNHRGLSPVDWVVIAAYGLFMIGVGWWVSRRQTTSEEYFLGSRKMGSFIVGISIHATLLSTISYLGVPGEMIKHGPIILCSFIALPLVFAIVGYLLVPHLMKLRVTSAYELLEVRLGLGGRLLGGVIFTLTRLVWMAFLIYLASEIVTKTLNWPMSRLPYVVAVAGLAAVIYTFLGGLRAVVITDFFQFVILFGGAIATIVIITVKLGGFGWWPTEWAANWAPQPILSLNPTVRATALGAITANVIWWVCTSGSDQVVVQRYLATPSAKTARRSFLTTVCTEVLVTSTLACVGFALLGFFRANPQALPANASVSTDADKLFPHFITNFLSPGLAGLVIAGMFAAAMSSLDSGINSIVTVFTTDFLPRLRKTNIADKQKLKLAKYMVLGIGVAVVLISSMMGYVPGNIMEVTSKTNGLFVAPLFILFFLALFVRFSNAFGALFGALYGFVAAAIWGYWDVIVDDEAWRLSFQWIMLVSLVAGIGVGVLLSWLWARRKRYLAYVLAVVPLLAVIGYVVFRCMTSRL